MSLYIQMFSVHGLVRGESPELGRDADTGGQVKYVLELARSLAGDSQVDRVDLVTRFIQDKTVSTDYSQAIEPLAEKADLVRIQCGGRKYIRKELLWPYLDEMIDKTLKFIKAGGRVPDIFHGHYADGGYVARELAAIFGVPFIFTGHSMGRHKKNKLLDEGMSVSEINRRYHIDHRIEIEEQVIRDSSLIVTSTSHEIEQQYGLYNNFSKGNYKVIPPGLDIDTFYPYYDAQFDATLEGEHSKQARIALQGELHRFWVEQDKPFILALCRPDQRKNISGLIKAYGHDKTLQAMANLAIFAGIRKNIAVMEENERNVLTEMLLLMDRYDLYGRLAIPKKHDFTFEVPELYRLCADSRGIFVNPALVEPFGLTLIEAASCGVPIVATKNGGPEDIIGNCQNGLLIDPSSSREIGESCKKILADKETWETFSRNGINGVRSHYSWLSHSKAYLKSLEEMKDKSRTEGKEVRKPSANPIGRRLTEVKRLFITDIDNTLLGDDKSLALLMTLLDEHRDNLGWGVATGRCINKTLQALEEHKLVIPDIIITSVGTEINYGPDLRIDKGWQQHLSYQWRPEAIRHELTRFDFLGLQNLENQRRYKISYLMKDDPDLLAQVHQALQSKNLKYNLIFSHGQFLDILPCRAGKGKAVRYLSYKWGIPLPQILVSGDSGNDECLLRGDTCGVVVGNFSRELESLKGGRRIYFSPFEYAAGIIDGFRHYSFV
jgi:sucrose-phosphate synthase